jgi:putative hydrolase of the HAD superfamily
MRMTQSRLVIPPLSQLKAVLFDAFDTLILLDKDELPRSLAVRCGYIGVEVSTEQMIEVWKGVKPFMAQASKDPAMADSIRARGRDYWERVFTFVLGEIGVQGDLRDWAGRLYESPVPSIGLEIPPDVPWGLSRLREMNLTIGLITNTHAKMPELAAELGLAPLLDFIVTSTDAGAEKPDPRIFQLALEKAEAESNEAIFVGDVYVVDVLGSEAVGIAGILIDRNGKFPDVEGPRIESLMQLPALLQGSSS